MMEPYDDMSNLPHHVSATHPRMSAHDRAAQFSPFAALTCYDTAIKETARLTDQRIELEEYIKADLNERLNRIQDQMADQPEVSITYFQPDKKKTGGVYMTVNGCVKKVDAYERTVVMLDGTKIPIDDILEVEIQ